MIKGKRMETECNCEKKKEKRKWKRKGKQKRRCMMNKTREWKLRKMEEEEKDV